jgi:hypothetical protein
MSIAVIVPSRGRPGNIVELVEAWAQTRTSDSRLFVMIDDDDPTAEQYPTAEQLPSWASIHVGPRRRLGGTLNHAASQLALTWPIIGFMGDDHRPRTRGWDVRIEQACTDLSVVYGNDLLQGQALPTAVFLDARVVARLGWMVVPGMVHLFMDNLWKRIGEELGTLRYLDDVVIEHVHPVAGKTEWDAGYAEANSGETWSHDEALYQGWLAADMAQDIARVRTGG